MSGAAPDYPIRSSRWPRSLANVQSRFHELLQLHTVTSKRPHYPAISPKSDPPKQTQNRFHQFSMAQIFPLQSTSAPVNNVLKFRYQLTGET